MCAPPFWTNVVILLLFENTVGRLGLSLTIGWSGRNIGTKYCITWMGGMVVVEFERACKWLRIIRVSE